MSEHPSPEFFKNHENYFYDDHEGWLEFLNAAPVGTELYLKFHHNWHRTPGGEPIRKGPFRLVGYYVDSSALETEWYGVHQHHVREVLRRAGNTDVCFSAFFQDTHEIMEPHWGQEYWLTSDPDFDLDDGHWDDSWDGPFQKVEMISMGRIERPDAWLPPAKQMLTSVNLHRLAHGKSVLAKGIPNDELLALYKETLAQLK